jgi:hypothetical protein
LQASLVQAWGSLQAAPGPLRLLQVAVALSQKSPSFVKQACCTPRDPLDPTTATTELVSPMSSQELPMSEIAVQVLSHASPSFLRSVPTLSYASLQPKLLVQLRAEAASESRHLPEFGTGPRKRDQLKVLNCATRTWRQEASSN